MSVGRICVRSVATITPGETLRAAAQRMRENGVGSLVVVDGKTKPVGLLTDRDLMLRCVADAGDADEVRVAQAMSTPVVTASEAMPIEDVLSQMSASEIRRVPVVDEAGTLVGILALDDVLDLLSEEVTTIGRLLSGRTQKV
ncbi:MAG: CBS domain-containing protein [Deltaproteobacteria bacterium]|nr:CBS domain-containing protein [Deltaproteobacteria bacterium]